MPGPPLRATSPPPATSSTKIWASTSAGEKVAVRLSPPDSTSTTSSGAKSRLEVLDGQQVGGDVVADRGVRAGAGLDRPDPLRGEHPGRAQEPRVLVGVDVVGDHAEPQLGGELAAEQSRSASSCRCRPGRRPPAAGLAGWGSVSQARNNLLRRCGRGPAAQSSISGAPVAGMSSASVRPATSVDDRVDVAAAASTHQRGRVGRVERAAA